MRLVSVQSSLSLANIQLFYMVLDTVELSLRSKCSEIKKKLKYVKRLIENIVMVSTGSKRGNAHYQDRRRKE